MLKNKIQSLRNNLISNQSKVIIHRLKLKKVLTSILQKIKQNQKDQMFPK